MRSLVALVACAVVLALVNWTIQKRERHLETGRVVYLELAPVDPRSLMQGDYMRLDFALANQAFPFGTRKDVADGKVIVAVDQNRVATFRRLDDRRPLAAGEIAMRYRMRGGWPNFGTNAYFFEEGSAKAYENARYGEFRVGEDGDMILTGLRDDKFRPLGPKR